MKINQWEDIKETYRGGCLVMGNGASVAIHKDFSYGSLRQAANDRGLLGDAGRVFDGFGTDDFEAVLRLLWHADLVNEALRTPSERVTQAYQDVRRALIETVRATHLPHGEVNDSAFTKPADSILRTKREFLTTFHLVVSLNYDLLAYWAVMTGGEAFVDDSFRRDDEGLVFQGLPEKLESKSTYLIYPHGNLCLAKDQYDQEVKLSRGEEDLLTTALQAWESGRYIPLFVSEGTSERKKRSIKASPYLGAAYAAIGRSTQKDTLVLYGWRMGEQDKHIEELLKGRKPSRVAVSVYNAAEANEQELKTTVQQVEDTFGVPPDLFASDSAGKWSVRSAEVAAQAAKKG